MNCKGTLVPRPTGREEQPRAGALVPLYGRGSARSLHGKPVDDETQFSVCLQEYYLSNAERKLGIPKDALTAGGTMTASTSFVDVVEEYLRNNQNLDRDVEGRIVVKQRVAAGIF